MLVLITYSSSVAQALAAASMPPGGKLFVITHAAAHAAGQNNAIRVRMTPTGTAFTIVSGAAAVGSGGG